MTARAHATRRWVVGIVAAVAAVAVSVREWPLRRHHPYRRTPYDDLLSNLGDRESSATFGRGAIKNAPGSSAAIATLLRQRLKTSSLRALAARELSEGHVFVAGGWVVPESLALMCALAARDS